MQKLEQIVTQAPTSSQMTNIMGTQPNQQRSTSTNPSLPSVVAVLREIHLRYPLKTSKWDMDATSAAWARALTDAGIQIDNLSLKRALASWQDAYPPDIANLINILKSTCQVDEKYAEVDFLYVKNKMVGFGKEVEFINNPHYFSPLNRIQTFCYLNYPSNFKGEKQDVAMRNDDITKATKKWQKLMEQARMMPPEQLPEPVAPARRLPKPRNEAARAEATDAARWFKSCQN